MASSFFHSNNCSRSVLAKNWRLCMQLAASACKLYPRGRQSHAAWIKSAAICMRLAATRVLFACVWWPRGYNLHATGGHSGTICMRLTATPLQDKRQADKRCVKGRLYSIIIFLSKSKSTSLNMLLTIQLTALGFLVLKMRWYYGWQSHTEANFARVRDQLHAKPPVFCKHAARTIIWITNEEALKNLRIYVTHVLNKCYPSTLHGPIQSHKTVPLKPDTAWG